MTNQRRTERASRSELHLSEDQFQDLSGQVRVSYEKIDDLLAHMLRMNADMIDTAKTIGLEPEQGQRLFKKISVCVTDLVQGREDLVSAHLEATKIRMRTNQAERADGCYLPRPWQASSPEGIRLVG